MSYIEIFNIYLLFVLLRGVFYVCVGLFYLPPKQLYKNYLPKVSVIIPAWNEEVGITKTIKSVLNNTYSNLKIIVVNDGSRDNTENKVLEILNSYPERISLINQTNSGKAMALNAGIKASTGEIIVTIDADSYIKNNAVELLVRALSDPYYDCAVGSIRIGNTKTFFGMIQYLEYIFGFHYKKTQSIFGSIYIFPGALSAFRKEKIDSVGYFENYSKTEDLDISIKLRHNGHKVAYVEDAVCVTEGASDLKGLINQRTRWRHGFLQCILHRKDFLFNTQKGFYLTYIELPFALIGILEILIFPVFLFFTTYLGIVSGNYLIFIISYLFMPIEFLLITGTYKLDNKNLIKNILLIPIYFYVVAGIEFVALVKSLYRLISRRQTEWTKWNRLGV